MAALRVRLTGTEVELSEEQALALARSARFARERGLDTPSLREALERFEVVIPAGGSLWGPIRRHDPMPCPCGEHDLARFEVEAQRFDLE